MELIKKFANKSVFLDSAPLIYYIEENKEYAKVLEKLFAALKNYNYLNYGTLFRIRNKSI